MSIMHIFLEQLQKLSTPGDGGGEKGRGGVDGNIGGGGGDGGSIGIYWVTGACIASIVNPSTEDAAETFEDNSVKEDTIELTVAAFVESLGSVMYVIANTLAAIS